MKKKKLIIIISALLIAILFLFNNKSFSKYVTDRIKSYYLQSKHFYFSSNLLDTNNTEYQISTWSGVGPFSISFNLYSRDNEYLFSESDITYVVTATCSEDVTCTVTNGSGTLYTNDNDHAETVTININPGRVFLTDERVTINVTANSTSPYEKTIQARFVYIVGHEGVSYEIDDEANRTYLLLKVKNDINYCTVTEDFGDYTTGDILSDTEYRALRDQDKSKCISKNISVSFNPNDLLIDNTGKIMDIASYETTTINNINYINNISFAISPNSTESIKFYKKNIAANNTYPNGNNSSIITVVATDPIQGG